MKQIIKKAVLGLVAIAAILAAPASAFAVPTLQIYIEGATYDDATDTWVLETETGSFNLWVIGNVGAVGTIYDVKLSGAVSTTEAAAGGTATVTGSGSTTTPTYNGLSADGAVPVTGDGSLLPTHGIYGTGTSFFEWSLGDFTSSATTIYDYQTGWEGTTSTATGQINVYTVTLSGLTTIHFDTYDHFIGENNGKIKYVQAPFSHDGETNVPEPGTLLLLGAGLAGLSALSRKLKA